MKLGIYDDETNGGIENEEKTIIEIAMLIIAAILISIVIFMMLFYRKTSMISVEPNEVTSVRIVNGNNGNMLELSEEEISDLTNRCRVIDCKRIINKEPGSGWSYSIDFSYGNTSKSIVLVSSELCEIDNVYYRMEEKDGEDVINIIKKFYEENKERIKSGSMIENWGNIRVKFDMKYDQEVITMYEENKAKEQLMAALKAEN